MHTSGDYSGIAALLIVGIVLFILIGLPALLITIFVSHSSKYAHRKKLLDDNTIVPEYTPPDNLTPAEIGYLFDSRIDKTELVATQLDLELKGFIQFGNREIGGLVINKTQTSKSTAELKGHEVYILNALTQEQNYTIFALTHIVGFKQSVKNVLRTEGYVRSTAELIEYFFKRTALVYIFVTLPLLILVAFISKFNIMAILFGFLTIYVALFPFFIFIALVTGALYSKIVGQPGIWTQKMKVIWPKLEGYKEYVKQVDLDQIQYESDELKIATKNTALPYAIIYGLKTDWENRFI